MTRLRYVLLLVLLLPFPLLAQTGSLTGVALDNVGNTVAGATITACNVGAVGIPCSPVVASTTSNGQGAFSMVVPVGTYTVTVFRLGVVATSSTVVVAPSNITVANTVTYTGNVTIGPGNLTVSGTGTLKNLNNTQFADQYSGTDPCNGITSAAAVLPSTGGIVDATAYQGAFTCVAGVTLSTKPVTVKLGMGLTMTGPCPLFTITSDGQRVSGSSTGLFDLTGSQYGTKLVCSSGTNAIAVGTVGVGSPRVNGELIENLSVNCNSQAASGLILDVVQNSLFSNLQFSNCTSQGVQLQVSNTGANVNNQFNQFQNISGSNDPKGINLTNNVTGLGGETQNTFTNINFNFTGTAGLDCGGGDNNRFFGLTLFRSSGTGNAIVMETPSASVNGCLFDYFNGVIGGNSGVSPILVKTGNFGSSVQGLDFVNGESAVTLQGTSELYVNGTLLCGTSCPSTSGSHPAAWFYWNTNPGTSNPTGLTAGGIALGNNFSNGGGETDIFMNFGGGTGAAGAYRFYRWDGATATLFATIPFAQIGNIVGSNASSALVFDAVYGTYRVTADQTITAGASLANIPGLSWTMPASTALNVGFTCKLLYNETTAATSMSFGIQDVTVAPTSLMAKAREQTGATAFNAGNLPALTTTTATAIGAAFTPSAATTVWEADIDGMIEQPSNAATSVINIMAQFTTNNGVIKRGSYCQVF